MNISTLSADRLSRARSGASGFVLALLGALVASSVYLLTLSKGLGWHDSAELALRAALLGGTHSPGSPLHTTIAYVFVQFFDSPATATNVLSAISMGAGAGLLAMLVWQFIGRLSVLAALIFACSYQVWTNAVVTELYGLSTFFCLLSCVLLWQWHVLGRTFWFVAAVLVYGLALGTWFANLLLAPAFLWLAISHRDRGMLHGLLFCAIAVLAVACIVTANIWLTLRLPPHGPDLPLSIDGVFRYMSGAMHEPLAVRNAAFFIERLQEHVLIFSRSFLWVGVPLGLFGLYESLRIDKSFGGFLLAMFAIQMAYFTFFGAGDYYSMVIFCYAIFSLWIVVAVAAISTRFSAAKIPLLALLAVMPPLQAWQQLPQRIMQRDVSPAQNFVDQSLAGLPVDALLVAGWQQFTALEYGQQIQGRRPDLQIILPATSLRHYGDIRIDNYLAHIEINYCSRPVLTHKVTAELEHRYRLVPVAGLEGWFRLEDRSAVCAPS